MALTNEEINITTIEKDEERYKEAIKNINKMKLDKRINVILKDALEVNINDKYDLIFIDASKGHNIDFFNKFKNNLNREGVMKMSNIFYPN